MRIWTIILPAIFLSALCSAQLSDDFSDGNITSDPVWSGNVSDFLVTPQGVLRLNAAAAGTSRIHADVDFTDSVRWEFYYKMEFAPSTMNKLHVYLMLDGTDLSTANGYFIEIGENGSTDALRFFRLDAGVSTMIGASAGLFGSDPSEARIRVTRDINDQWTFFADQTGGTTFTELFTLTESVHSLASATVFCLECIYSDTRKDKFVFDDIFAGLPAPDTSAPVVTQLVVNDSQHLTLSFNESLEETAALDVSHYHVQPGAITPINVVFSGSGQQTIVITLTAPLTSGQDYTIEIDGVTDLSGNVLSVALPFQFIAIEEADAYDILINEIMADPSPVIGLPNAEYVELYNRSEKTLQLTDYSLTVGSNSILLPAYTLGADAYVILVDEDDAALFSAFQNVLPVNLPALTNSGTTLELSDDSGQLLHRISYTLASYQDPARDDGGWSLELINPQSPCLLQTNLRASADLTGGTPGRKNSVTIDGSPDTEGPVLLQVFPVNLTTLRCTFDEVLSEDIHVFALEPAIAINSISIDDNVAEIILQSPLQEGTLYTLSVQVITDCIGNTGTPQSGTFALPQEAEAGDLLINELLFDPGTGGSRFIELINISNKYLDLADIIIADIQGDTISVVPVETSFLVFPGSIVAVSPNTLDIRTRYPTHDPSRLVENSIPAFDRSQGNATIYTRQGTILDAFDYDEEYHNALLDNTQGVSLERLSTSLNTQSPETWYSAAATAGYATPGLPNSQQLPGAQAGDEIIVAPNVFSPDGDGTDDLLTIQFPGISPGLVASVRIFDAQGREITRLAENVSVGAEAILTWDGSDQGGDPVRIGPYILWIETYDATGDVKQYKKTCVLARRL